MRNLIRPLTTLAVGALLAAAALAQTTAPSRMPSLIASNDCTAGECVRQMLPFKQLETWQQTVLSSVFPKLPLGTAASRPSTSCTWHEHAQNQWTLICLSITSEGTCACVITASGGSCLGSNPYCPPRI